MRIDELLTSIRNRLKAVNVPGVGEHVYYPQLNDIPQSPCIMIRQARNVPTQIDRTRARGQQQVSIPVQAVILVAAGMEQPREEARLDPLIHPVIDAFDPQVWGMDIADLLQVNSSEIDHVFQEAQVLRQQVEWAPSLYAYAAFITFDAVIRRRANA